MCNKPSGLLQLERRYQRMVEASAAEKIPKITADWQQMAADCAFWHAMALVATAL
jgi:hypothetical protein